MMRSWHMCQWLALGAFGVACSTSSASPDGSPDAGPDVDARADNGGVSTDVHQPPSDCQEQLRSFDDRCASDEECALVIIHGCSIHTERPALGIRRDQLAAFRELANECGVAGDIPCGGGGGEGVGPGPITTDHDDEVDDAQDAQAGVRCIAGSCQTLRLSCGTELCGNGAIDQCSVSEGPFGPVFSPVATTDGVTSAESCDGTDLAQSSCTSLGHGSGTLHCVPDSCLLSSRDCHACFDLGERLYACDGALGESATNIALAAVESEIAVAWFRGASLEAKESLRFTRFGLDLTRLSETDPGIVTPQFAEGWAVSLAKYRDGWAVALDGRDMTPEGANEHTIELYAFDAQGGFRGLVQRIAGANDPILVPRPSGSPLLAYTAGGWVRDAGGGLSSLPVEACARMLSDDLATSSEPTCWGAGVATAGVFIGDAFLVVGKIGDYVRTARIEVDGARVAPTHDIAYSSRPERLAVTATGPYLIHGFVPVRLAKLDNQGAVLSSIELPDMTMELGGMLGVGADVVIARDRDSFGAVELVRVDVAGGIVWQVPIAAHPSYSNRVYRYRLAQSGSDIVVGWVSGEGLGLAKVRP